MNSGDQSAQDRLNLTRWLDSRGSVWFHEVMHMQYFMGVGNHGSEDDIPDLKIDQPDGSTGSAYGIVNAKRVANYDRTHTRGHWSSRNCECHALPAFPFLRYLSNWRGLTFPLHLASRQLHALRTEQMG